MLPFFVTATATNASIKTIPIVPIITRNFPEWLAEQDTRTKNWVAADLYKADACCSCFIMSGEGQLERVLIGVDHENDHWPFATLARLLPTGTYHIDAKFSQEALSRAALYWALGTYQFTPYKKQPPIVAKLQLPAGCNEALLDNTVRSVFLVRDLINTPTDDLGPAELGEAVVKLGAEFGAEVSQIIGDDLLVQGFPTIHAVGRASVHEPRLIDLHWGDATHPKVTLVGKGVCFDSGGLDLKSAAGMLLMRKDMGGAAHVLAIARLVMAMQLPVHLRVLIPAVENAVSGDSYHPGDIITTRKGITVEVTNTDAEGRLILCDALAAAAEDNPAIIIDFATLTGAASIALGPEIPGFFTNDEKLAQELQHFSQQQQEMIWRMPLYRAYRRYLDSAFADILNAGLGGYAGMICAALFLQEFVPPQISWVHFDLMAWNPETKMGRIVGGEAMGIRTVFDYLANVFAPLKKAS